MHAKDMIEAVCYCSAIASSVFVFKGSNVKAPLGVPSHLVVCLGHRAV